MNRGRLNTCFKRDVSQIPAGLPRSVEAAVERYGASSGFKAPVATVLDANNKLSTSLTYGEIKLCVVLLSR